MDVNCATLEPTTNAKILQDDENYPNRRLSHPHRLIICNNMDWQGFDLCLPRVSPLATQIVRRVVHDNRTPFPSPPSSHPTWDSNSASSPYWASRIYLQRLRVQMLEFCFLLLSLWFPFGLSMLQVDTRQEKRKRRAHDSFTFDPPTSPNCLFQKGEFSSHLLCLQPTLECNFHRKRIWSMSALSVIVCCTNHAQICLDGSNTLYTFNITSPFDPCLVLEMLSSMNVVGHVCCKVRALD